MESTPTTAALDVVVVGAGFSGIYALHKLRQLGLDVQIFEAGGDVGGVWFWNRYPGARVDSEWPFYQLSLPEVWSDFNFSERFPTDKEIREYFAHAVNVLDLRKDINFNACVNSAEWSEETGRWTVKTEAGHQVSAKYLFLCTGLLHRRHYPDFPGFSKYKGAVYHSGSWPSDLDVTGKKVCIVGAGATSVQLTQELAKKASSLSVLMRRPSLCLPLGNRGVTKTEQDNWKPFFPALFREGRLSAGGLPHTPPKKSIFDVSDEERTSHYETLWRSGSFGFGGANYSEIFMDLSANRLAYDFWAKKTRARITDVRKRELMAPVEPPYPILTKRCPLEHDYYEMLDKPNVDIVDIKANPIRTFTSNGILFENEDEIELDCVILATGFESFTGSVANMGLKDKEGRDIKDLWSEQGISTYLGMLIRGFPNCFMSYSPHAPTALSNGPTILECQVDFVVSAIEKLEKEGVGSIEPSQQAQDSWVSMINEASGKTLYPLTASWWTASNVPGKKPQMLSYIGGIAQYEKQCRETLEEWKGFEIQKSS
ncbi:cyclopentanone 1,2-monooxygenase [Fusarium napiforme]|uniref:Cyclopentanone 1,2-monooxygenase n=1 Tax=Fusarium napiforme TaxID=42672 RepID=A0A8H5N8V2_9HYPO|nr:cyclopentanone 1,2-monooxygenase [Fusarium napiforme]